MTYLFITLLTVVGILPFQQVSLDILLQGLKEVGMVTNINIQGGEGFLSLVPVEITSRFTFSFRGNT